MKSLRKHIFALLCVLLFTPSATFALDMLGVNDEREVAVTSSGPSAIPTPPSQLLRNPQVRLSEKQFLDYLDEVKALNPKATWQQIITKMHYEQYRSDSSLVIAGIPLFHNGKENEGWEKVKLPNNYQPPKFIIDQNGKLVDIAHAYAGIRAGLNRKGITSWTMKNVNTNWGDGVQVGADYVKGARQYLAGLIKFDKNKRKNGAKMFSEAPNLKPPNQVRGNDIGIATERYLRQNEDADLRQAFSAIFQGRAQKKSGFLKTAGDAGLSAITGATTMQTISRGVKAWNNR